MFSRVDLLTSTKINSKKGVPKFFGLKNTGISKWPFWFNAFMFSWQM